VGAAVPAAASPATETPGSRNALDGVTFCTAASIRPTTNCPAGALASGLIVSAAIELAASGSVTTGRGMA